MNGLYLLASVAAIHLSIDNCDVPADIFEIDNDKVISRRSLAITQSVPIPNFDGVTINGLKKGIGIGRSESIIEGGQKFLCFKEPSGRHIVFSSGAMGGWNEVTSVYVGFHANDLPFENKCVRADLKTSLTRNILPDDETLNDWRKKDGIFRILDDTTIGGGVVTTGVIYSVNRGNICWINMFRFTSQ